MPVVGLEAEFTLLVDGQPVRPEVFFGTPRRLLGGKRLPARQGRSCQLPTGGALYFDTGVIEVATPIFEIERGCCTRAVKSLWEQIAWVRRRLDAWEKRTGRRLALQGFSAHYNVSIHRLAPVPREAAKRHALAKLLCHLIPAPMMLLAANRESSAIGIRARPGGRFEFTADFTPDPPLMRACLAFLIGLVQGVVTQVARRGGESRPHVFLSMNGLPRVAGFRPSPHSSRRGWRATSRDFPANPFRIDPSARSLPLAGGRTVSLRQLAGEIHAAFRDPIRAAAGPWVHEHIEAIFDGRARSFLDFERRPGAYDDVGRDGVRMHRRFIVSRSAYERVIHRVIARDSLKRGGQTYDVRRIADWYHVIFRNRTTGKDRVFNLDELVAIWGERRTRPRHKRAPRRTP
jgi:hypothetical protein